MTRILPVTPLATAFLPSSGQRCPAPRFCAELLEAACGYAAQAGAAVIEAYPSPDGKAYRYMGTRELYRAAGFDEVPVPAGSRPVMRRPT